MWWGKKYLKIIRWVRSSAPVEQLVLLLSSTTANILAEKIIILEIALYLRFVNQTLEQAWVGCFSKVQRYWPDPLIILIWQIGRFASKKGFCLIFGVLAEWAKRLSLVMTIDQSSVESKILHVSKRPQRNRANRVSAEATKILWPTEKGTKFHSA